MKRIAIAVAFLFVTSMVMSSFLTRRADAANAREFAMLIALLGQNMPCVVSSDQGLDNSCP